MIYDAVGNSTKVSSWCNWYEFGEKLNKFCLNLEKECGCQNMLQNIILKNGELIFLQQINPSIFSCYQDLFSKKCNANNTEVNLFLKSLTIPKLLNFQRENCKGVLSKKESFESIKNFQNNKSPGKDGLTKEFYYDLWDVIKQPFMNSMSESNWLKHLSTSQKQAIIKILEKPNKDKRFICNQRQISLLNFDQK